MPLVFITGSGRRLGKGLAIEFAKSGWDVIIHYNLSEQSAFNTLNIVKSFGRKSICVKADVLDYKQLSEAFNFAFTEMGIPDVLINNSGIFPPKQSLIEIEPAMWDNVIGINLRGEFYTSKIFALNVQKNLTHTRNKLYRIINIASIGAFGVWKQRIPYNVSKSGIIQLTKVLARELAPRFTVNCVCPGSIHIPEEPSENDIDFLPVERIPMKRYGNVKDIFDAVWFFANASEYITGQVISVDGGYQLNY